MLKSILFAVLATAFLVGLNFAVSAQTEFTVRVENVSSPEGLVASDGTRYPFALSPGIFVVNKGRFSLVQNGMKATAGIESLAEDGNPSQLAMEVGNGTGKDAAGVFNVPVGGGATSPILSGGAYQFKFTASKGAKLNLMTMFGQSNDLFYAFAKPVDLFRNGKPINGDISWHLVLWDAGTEVNQSPGIGPDQGPRQAMANTGTVENGTVRFVNDGFKYPSTSDVVRVTIVSN